MIEIKQTEREIAEVIVRKLKKLCENEVENERVHILDFMVENVPESVTDEKSDWNNATGCYGVSTITTPFDNESLLLAIGYYGGMENISTITIRTHYDINWEEITGEIAYEIHYQIAMEIPTVIRFLIKYKEE